MNDYLTTAQECAALVDAGVMSREEAQNRIHAASGGRTVLGASDTLHRRNSADVRADAARAEGRR